MNSQWLEGTVRHRRKFPVSHEFQYSTGMLALDLDEWDQVTETSPLFSLERFNWLSLRRSDYFNRRLAHSPMRSAIRLKPPQAGVPTEPSSW